MVFQVHLSFKICVLLGISLRKFQLKSGFQRIILF
uniref:Uncharacterized protein n=1 Tax=Anguilla anguilla TaxID=7936 RepID=A0A0E9QY37_ANGAN